MARLYTLIKQYIYSVFQSIGLDVYFLKFPFFSAAYKIAFLTEKYHLIVRYLWTRQFKLGESSATISDQQIFYNAPFGLAPFQYVIKTMYPLLKNMNVSESPLIVDIGANVGYLSLLLHHLYPSATIHCFEPVPDTFQALQKNLHINPHLYAYNQAISSDTSPRKINYTALHNELSYISDTGNLPIKTQTLDSFINQNNITLIDLLKIDTEGHEYEVLKGATTTLQKTRYLLIEITLVNNKNYTFTSLIKLLSTPDYNFQLLQIRPVPNSTNPHYMDCLFINTSLLDATT